MAKGAPTEDPAVARRVRIVNPIVVRILTSVLDWIVSVKGLS